MPQEGRIITPWDNGGGESVILKHTGTWAKTEAFLQGIAKADFQTVLEKYAKKGVEALAAATPVDTGKTASSWGYKISRTRGGFSISFTNSNVVNGVPIAIILQYGHGARNGGYVQGRDYINPALQPVFDEMANSLWKEAARL